MKEKIFVFVFGLVFIWLAASAISSGIEKSERAECIRWQREAHQYDNYYLTPWQYAQCYHHGIIVDAELVNVPE